jgi:3-methylfumaryl-CoA hydratase
MWAGGELTFHRGLRVGETVTKTSTITDVQHKSSRTGELWFVTVDHDYSVNGETALTERHDIVYRAMPEKRPAPAAAPALAHTAQFGRALRPIRSCCSAFRR